jgi:hypothetical protein
MNDPEFEYIDRARIENGLGRGNLTYNLQRNVQLIRLRWVSAIPARLIPAKRRELRPINGKNR